MRGRYPVRVAIAYVMIALGQVGAISSTDEIAAFLSGLVGQYKVGAAIEELRKQVSCGLSNHYRLEPQRCRGLPMPKGPLILIERIVALQGRDCKVHRALAMVPPAKFTKRVRVISEPPPLSPLHPALAIAPAATPAASPCLSMMLASPAAAPAAAPTTAPAAAPAAAMPAALVAIQDRIPLQKNFSSSSRSSFSQLVASRKQRASATLNSESGPSSLPFAIDDDDDGGGGAAEAAFPAAPAPAAHVAALSLIASAATSAVLPSPPLPRITTKAAGVDVVFQSAIQDRVPLQKNFSSSSRPSFSQLVASTKQRASATCNSESGPVPLAACKKKPWGKRGSIAPCDDALLEEKKRLSSVSGSYFASCA